MTINKNIEENLNYYLKRNNPEYAFLLTGKWGVGKTYFVDDYISKIEDFNIKPIKISLFGLKSTDEINEKIFEALHPLLGHKYTKIATNLVKGAFSMGLRLDLNGDNSPDSIFSFSPKDINTPESEPSKDVVIFFDDLERTDIKITEILGFINNLVEVSKLKVVIVANEKYILKSGAKKNKYLEFKEKVIGKTFNVEHDINFVLNDFLHTTNSTKLKCQFETIKDVYLISKYDNLRHLKKCIGDFEYIEENLDDTYLNNNEFYTNLVRVFFSLSFEIGNGKLPKDKFIDSYLVNKDFVEQINKYEIKDMLLYKFSIWKEVLFDSNCKRLNHETQQLVYFIEPTEKRTPNWVKLWNFRELENEQFKDLMTEIEGELQELVEQDVRIFLHKIAIVLFFSKRGLSRLSLEEINEIVDYYVEKYKESEHWELKELSFNSFSNGTGYGYLGSEDNEFIKIKNRVEREKEKSYNVGCGKIIDNHIDVVLLELKDNSLNRLTDLLVGEYNHAPFLNKFDSIRFFELLCSSDNKLIVDFNDLIYKRYEDNYYVNGRPVFELLVDELDFLNYMNQEIMKIDNDEPTLKRFILKNLSEFTINPAIERLSN